MTSAGTGGVRLAPLFPSLGGFFRTPRLIRVKRRNLILAGAFALVISQLVIAQVKSEPLTTRNPSRSAWSRSTNQVVFKPPFVFPETRTKPFVPVRPLGHHLAPGAYNSLPYTAIIIVPPVHPDEQSSVARTQNEASGESNMPIVKPELRLVPRR